MRWSEVDMGTGLWTIPRERIKNGLAQGVPLPDLAIALLNEQLRLYGREMAFESGAGGSQVGQRR